MTKLSNFRTHSQTQNLRLRLSCLCLGLFLGGVVYAQAPVTQPPVAQPPTVQATTQPKGPVVKPAEGVTAKANPAQHPILRFSFDGVAWREVIRWIADEGDLALHVTDLPTGSFTYSDPGAYTHQGAVDRINLFLLPQGFTLVRSGKLLSVINLSDPRSTQQLDALASMVALDDLSERENHDVVKCIFPLGELEAEEAVQELSALNLMTTPKVFSKTNQIMITDTAAKLKNVKQILDAFRPDEMSNGTVVKSFALEHVDAEDILEVARPHLGLATGEMIGIDVSLSADLRGKNIFVTGIEDKVKLLEGLVNAIDTPAMAPETIDGTAELKSYVVEGGNVETIYNVLQTLLAGKSVRLSMDEEARSVVALATPEVQREIAATVEQLQASEDEFEMIPLKTVDPYFAISLLEEMLDLPGSFDDPEDIDPDAPKIDADPANMRLFVRGKRYKIEQIKKIVAGLDVSGSVSGLGSNDMRIFPLKGKQAELILETAVKFWRGGNPVVLFRSTVSPEPTVTERVVGDPADDPITLTSKTNGAVLDQKWLTEHRDSKLPIIRCQLTERGLLLQSDDEDALNQFEDHLRVVIGPGDTGPTPPIVFYLKYTKAVDALRMLAELLDGGDAAMESETSSLVNGYVSSSSSILGSLVTSRDGTTTLLAGSMTVVADTRLNRLIAQGTTIDIDRLEAYLSIIDKDNSITSIETYGTSHVIELQNSRATEVAVSIREAFAGRVSGGSQPQGAQPQGSPQQQAAAAKAAAKADSRDDKGKDSKDGKVADQNGGKKAPQPQQRGGGNRAGANLEPRMTIAVHEPSNSLIVTAPDQLFAEVEKLVKSIDARGEQSIEVVAPMNGELIELVLQQVLLGEASGSRQTPQRTSSAARPQPTRPKNDR